MCQRAEPRRQPVGYLMGRFGASQASHAGKCRLRRSVDGIVIVEPGVLGPKQGAVGVDLVERGYEATWDREIGPRFYFAGVHQRQVFVRTGRPSVVITIQRS